MFKVFLAEDESLVREGLRDNVPWEQCGFTFAGEAPDGEVALSQIRKIKPDLLITDIKMPFMDGLSLCRLVCRELPDIKVVILSGYDDFNYARRAIELRVSKYLLKPVTKSVMTQTLEELRAEMEKEREQKEFLRRYDKETQQYEQYSRRALFEDMTSGKTSVGEVYERAAALGIELNASCYNIALFSIRFESERYSERTSFLRDELVEFFLHRPEYQLFRWGFMDYAVLITGDADNIARRTDKCRQHVQIRCESESVEPHWYFASGTPVSRLSLLPECFEKVSRALFGRYLTPDSHILTDSETESMENLFSVSETIADPMVLRGFMQTGRPEEVCDFVDGYIAKLGDVAHSLLFRQYLMMSARFNAVIMVKSFGCTQEEFIEGLEIEGANGSDEYFRDFLIKVLKRAVAMRDKSTHSQYLSLVQTAKDYIDANFDNESISLNTVAKAVNVSANYFSAVFSHEVGLTFVEYLTQKRMEKARLLLRQTDKRTGEIAYEVGYKDPRYFSFIFKKTQGMSPRDFRAGRGEKS